MKQSALFIVNFGLFLGMIISCHSSKVLIRQAIVKQEVNKPSELPTATAPVLVYKTRNDYTRNVPVIMNESKTEIISYPDPSDLFFRGKLAFPTVLVDDYLLDNRGITINVAFLNYTYEEYSKLKKTPSMNELMNSIIDKNPLIELWNCGSRSRFKNEVVELNLLIGKHFTGCQQIFLVPTIIDFPDDIK
jgi:hypothetical protein